MKQKDIIKTIQTEYNLTKKEADTVTQYYFKYFNKIIQDGKPHCLQVPRLGKFIPKLTHITECCGNSLCRSSSGKTYCHTCGEEAKSIRYKYSYNYKETREKDGYND